MENLLHVEASSFFLTKKSLYLNANDREQVQVAARKHLVTAAFHTSTGKIFIAEVHSHFLIWWVGDAGGLRVQIVPGRIV
jgi:hypothetical protein